MSPVTYVKETSQPKVHFSEYLKMEDKPAEEEKPADTTQPEAKPAE